MKINSRITHLTIKSMSDSLGTKTMEQFTRHVIHNYDLYTQTGYPRNIPIGRGDAAKQIMKDIKDRGLYLEFIAKLIDFHYNGYMGRKYPIPRLRDVIKEIYDQGFIYDEANKCFIENSKVRKTRNWGTLRNDEEYIFTFLRADIVGNSQLVRRYPSKVINKTYKDLHDIVNKAQAKRDGRLWDWEGDGGIVAFYLANKNQKAVLTGMEIIHELFLYNQLHCQLDKPLHVRLAIHSGYSEYTNDIEKLKHTDTVRHLIKIEEKYTQPNTLTISETTARSLDTKIKAQLKPIKKGNKTELFSYQLEWE